MEGADPSPAKTALAERIVSAGFALPTLQGLGADHLKDLKTLMAKQQQFRAGILGALNGSFKLLSSLTTEDLSEAATDAAPHTTYMTPEQGGVFYVEELVRYALMKISSLDA